MGTSAAGRGPARPMTSSSSASPTSAVGSLLRRSRPGAVADAYARPSGDPRRGRAPDPAAATDSPPLPQPPRLRRKRLAAQVVATGTLLADVAAGCLDEDVLGILHRLADYQRPALTAGRLGAEWHPTRVRRGRGRVHGPRPRAAASAASSRARSAPAGAASIGASSTRATTPSGRGSTAASIATQAARRADL